MFLPIGPYGQMYWINERRISARQRRALYPRPNREIWYLFATFVLILTEALINELGISTRREVPIVVWIATAVLVVGLVWSNGLERFFDKRVRTAVLGDRKLSASTDRYSFYRLEMAGYNTYRNEHPRQVAGYFRRTAELDMLGTVESELEIDAAVETLLKLLSMSR